MDSNTVGDTSEAKLLTVFTRDGIRVLLPFSKNLKYDLVIECDGEFMRVQVKTGRLRNGAVTFDTCNSRKKESYYDQADIFAVYVPDIDRCYIVPVDMAGKAQCTLRYYPSKNNQKKNVRHAGDFEVHTGQVKDLLHRNR